MTLRVGHARVDFHVVDSDAEGGLPWPALAISRGRLPVARGRALLGRHEHRPCKDGSAQEKTLGHGDWGWRVGQVRTRTARRAASVYPLAARRVSASSQRLPRATLREPGLTTES